VYYQDTVQLISFYNGTTRDEIIATIKICFKLPKEFQMHFVDEDGVPVVLSGSMPNGTKLYMQVAESFDTADEKIKKESNNNKSNEKISSSKQVDIKILDGMKEWDPNKKTGGHSVVEGNKWEIENNYNWPFSCSTKDGITTGGTIYKYTVTFNNTSMRGYTHFGFCFEDEFGILKRNPCISLMPQFISNSNDNSTLDKWEVIVDLREGDDIQQGVYFVLLPENKCTFFTSFFGKNPTEEMPMYFTIWTKNAVTAIIQNVEVGDHIQIPKESKYQAESRLTNEIHYL